MRRYAEHGWGCDCGCGWVWGGGIGVAMEWDSARAIALKPSPVTLETKSCSNDGVASGIEDKISVMCARDAKSASACVTIVIMCATPNAAQSAACARVVTPPNAASEPSIMSNAASGAAPKRPSIRTLSYLSAPGRSKSAAECVTADVVFDADADVDADADADADAPAPPPWPRKDKIS